MVATWLVIAGIGLAAEPSASTTPASPVAQQTEDCPPAKLPPVKPESPFTHTLRVGPSVFAAVLSLNGAATGDGVRLDYSFQKGLRRFRWHVIASVQVSRAVYSTNTNHTGVYVAGFAGSGVRFDSNPMADAAFITEFDGTLGGGMLPTLDLIGMHWSLGGRLGTDWEILLSGEAQCYPLSASASAALMIGHAF